MEERERRFVSGFALILLGVGLIFIVPAAISHHRQVPPEAAQVDSIEAEKLSGLFKPPSYFVKQYMIGGAFLAASLACHFALKRR